MVPELLTYLPSPRSTICCLAFSPDGRQLAAGDSVGTLTLWDWKAGVSMVCTGSLVAVYAVAYSPDGTTVASAGRGHPHLWDAATGRHLLDLQQLDFATGLTFSADGTRLAGCALRYFFPGSVRRWTLEYGRGIQTLRGLPVAPWEVCISANGERLAANGQDGRVGVWDLKRGRLLQMLNGPQPRSPDNIALAFTSEDRQFACSAGEQGQLWDLRTGKVLDTWALPPGLVDRLAVQADGRLLLFRAEGDDARAGPRVCRIRDLRPGGMLRLIREDARFSEGAENAVAPAGGGQFVVAVSDKDEIGKRWTLRSYDATTGADRWCLPWTREKVPYLYFDPTGQLLGIPRKATARDGDTRTDVLDTSSGDRLRPVPGFLQALGLEAAHYVVGADELAPLRSYRGWGLCRRDDGALLVGLGIDAMPVFVPTFSPDGDLFAWGNTDGSVTVCDLPAIRERLREVGLDW